jgi:hypothetical protein
MMMVCMRRVCAVLVITSLHMLNLLGCTRSCHGTPVLAFNVQVCHNFVHTAAKHALQRHLQHVKQTTQHELNTVDAHDDATVTANGTAA